MGLGTPALGDILFYQRRGEEFLDFLSEESPGLAPPVVAVGHSLGGIVLVDLLSRPGAPPVDLLVTAGSQSPMLYAIDALDSIRWGKAQPRPFTPWLNIYNRQDFLSFRAARSSRGWAASRTRRSTRRPLPRVAQRLLVLEPRLRADPASTGPPLTSGPMNEAKTTWALVVGIDVYA